MEPCWRVLDGEPKCLLRSRGRISPCPSRSMACLLPGLGNKLSADTGRLRNNRAPVYGRELMDLNGAVALVTGGNGGVGQGNPRVPSEGGADLDVALLHNPSHPV